VKIEKVYNFDRDDIMILILKELGLTEIDLEKVKPSYKYNDGEFDGIVLVVEEKS